MRRPFCSTCYVIAIDPETGKGVLTFRYTESAQQGVAVRALGSPLAKGLGGVPQLAFERIIPLQPIQL